MTGLYVGGGCLVTRSYADDGIFFVLYLAALALFAFWEKIGKWVVTVWLSLWLITQFLSHEWYTIFGGGFMGPIEGKIRRFADTLHWLDIEGRYVPDVYHTVLHLLILSALAVTIVYIAKSRKRPRAPGS